ncbi:hypothetical protein AUK22_05880 [bacterium CG2_30_54_10]|nr:MAG: hypothetical protein AUK22_05880 [bacterium CG2_30_54_10]
MFRLMDRFFSLLLILDLAIFLILEIIDTEIQWAASKRAWGGLPSGAGEGNRQMLKAESSQPISRRDREARFLDRVGKLSLPSGREKKKLRQIALTGEPEIQMLALEILSRFPEQNFFVTNWLAEQDRKIVELVNAQIKATEVPPPPQLKALLEELTKSAGAKVCSQPSEGAGAGDGSSLKLGDPSAGSVEDLIPEFAEPSELFMALQNLYTCPEDTDPARAAALIRVGLLAENPFLRGAAVVALPNFPQPNCSELMKEMLNDPAENVRACVVSALCKLIPDQAVGELIRVLQEENSDEVLEAVLTNLPKLPAQKAMEILDAGLSRLPDSILPVARRLRKSLENSATASPPG